MGANDGARSRRAKLAAAVGALAAITVGLFVVAPGAFAHHPILSGVSTCEDDGTYTVQWTIANSETASERSMLVRAYTVAPDVGVTSGLVADPGYDGLVGPGYAGPGTVIAPNGSVQATTTGIPASTPSITLRVTGYWKYGDPKGPSVVVDTREFTVELGERCEPPTGSLIIKKVVTGSSAPADATYTVVYDNGAGTSGQVSVRGGESVTVSGLPYGSYTLTELNPPIGATISPNPAVVAAETPTVAVTVTNPYPDVGSLKVTKQVTGQKDGYVPGSAFTVSYSCSNGASGELQLVNGESGTVAGLPLGTTCTLAEVSKPATSGPSYVYGPEVFTPSDEVSIGSTSVVEVTLENPIERLFGGFSVTKQVTGATEGSVPGSTFTVSYSCSDGTSGDLVVIDGDTKGVGSLALGTTCTLTEVSKPATSGPAYVYGPEVFTPSNVVVVTANDTDNVTGIVLENPIQRRFGAFSVIKRVTGATDGYVEGSTFDVSYECDGGVSGTLTVADGETRTVGDLPVGTQCTLAEVSKPATSGPSYVYGPEVFTPSDEVTIGSTSTVEVVLENPIQRRFGAFSVTKQVTGATDGYVEGSTFDVSYECSNGAEGTLTVVDGESQTVSALPVGTTCTLAEVSKPATSGPSYVYGPEVFTPSNEVTIGSTSTVAVTLENRIEQLLGAFSVTKQVTGATEGYVEGSTFTVSYECDGDVSGTLTLTDGETRTVGDLPVGSTCALAEVSKPATSGPSYVYGPEVFTPSNEVTIGSTSTVAVALENPIERLLGGLVVTKQVTGATDGYVLGSTFGFELDCDGEDHDRAFTLEAGDSVGFDDIPIGTTCTLAEVDVPDAADGYVYGTAVLDPADGTVVIDRETEPVSITVENPIDEVPPPPPNPEPPSERPTVVGGIQEVPRSGGALPVTGGEIARLVVLALALALGGSLLVWRSRRST